MAETVGVLSALELKDKLEQGVPIAVLDVREDDERAYASIAIPGGILDLHVPLSEIQGRLEEIREAATGRSLVVYCHHGQRSMVAASWLLRQGLTQIENLDGGIDAWSRRVDPAIRRY